MQRPLFASLEEEGLSDFRFDLQKKLFRNNCPPTRFFLTVRKRPRSNRLSGQKKTAEKAAFFNQEQIILYLERL